MTNLSWFDDEVLVDAVLIEVAGLLVRLIERGEPGRIDLRGLPLSAACIADLEQRLGTGAICIQLDPAGRSVIHETGFPGVWWARHIDQAGRTAAPCIEVIAVPASLCADPAEMARGLRRLPGVTQVAYSGTNNG